MTPRRFNEPAHHKRRTTVIGRPAVRQLASLLLLAHVCPNVARSQCLSHSTVASLMAEVRRDTIATFPDTHVIRGPVKWRQTPLGHGSGVTLYTAIRNIDPSHVYRIASIGASAYRVVGWSCNNQEQWLRNVRPLLSLQHSEIWRRIYALAAAMNPVGDSTRFVGPQGLAGLPTSSTMPSGPFSGSLIPSLSVDSSGVWHGRVTVFWSNIGYHGLKAVNWDFDLDGVGRLILLRETPLRQTALDSIHVILDLRPQSP